MKGMLKFCCVYLVALMTTEAGHVQNPLAKGQLLADPKRCSTFYEFVPQLKHCPAGLVFNPEEQVCDWPENVNCSNNGIGDGYELFPGHGYYKLYTTGKTWDDARITCYNDQAHLMVINSDAEAEVVREFFSRNPVFHDVHISSYVFIGFHDKFTEGQYALVTGEPLSSSGYVQWSKKQPDGATEENYGGADKYGLLHDIVDSEKYGFICERE